jgi:hypothetical protein
MVDEQEGRWRKEDGEKAMENKSTCSRVMERMDNCWWRLKCNWAIFPHKE